MLTIGKLKLETAIQGDLDGRLAALTGCSAVEVHRLLHGHCIAGFLAKAITPLLVDPPARIDLTRAIAAAGVDRIRKRALRLYGSAIKQQKGEGHGPAQ